uniref:Putative secreted protein n=1 Tax=Haematobia irritans TaxID=7368 RepID=A0A1L8EIX6_HAEIR
MGPSELTLLSAVVLFITVLLGIPLNHADGEVIVDGSNISNEIKIPTNPIVIETQLQNYDEPTLKEYQDCDQNYEQCKRVCQGVSNVTECLKQCPICPILSIQNHVIQGVNDTQIRVSKPLNTTNIIRLTNHIRNVIDNSRGNITLNSANTVHLYQNVSRTGGQFGLGYNNTDPCCIIVRRKKNCDLNRFSTSSRCHHKRHRVCGKQCRSRVMMAKTVTVCDPPIDDYFESMNEDNCRQTVKYVPYNHIRYHSGGGHRCNYIPVWPYVNCPQQRQFYGSCNWCLQLPYAFILNNGVPHECNPCFNVYRGPNAFTDYFTQREVYPVDDHVFANDEIEFYESNGWKETSRKSLQTDGTIGDNWMESVGSGSHAVSPPITEDPENIDYQEYNYPDDDYFAPGPVVRRRRHSFPRSKYSRRNRRQ